MINTAQPASNSVYGREKLFWYDKINYSNHVCHCSAVVKELLACADKPVRLHATLFYTVFFFLSGLFFNTFFPFGFFFFLLAADPAVYALGLIYILSLSLEFYFGKGISESSWYAYRPSVRPEKKNISCQDMAFFWNSWIFFNISWLMTNHTHYTTNCTNLSPTPTSDPLAKVKLAFCTSS